MDAFDGFRGDHGARPSALEAARVDTEETGMEK